MMVLIHTANNLLEPVFVYDRRVINLEGTGHAIIPTVIVKFVAPHLKLLSVHVLRS